MPDHPFREAFEEMRRRLTTSPIMEPPDWELPFELMFDVFNYALGAVLAIVYALDKFRSYLLCFHITVYTDHAALRYL